MKNIIIEVLTIMMQIAMPIVIVLAAVYISAFYADKYVVEILTASILIAFASVGLGQYIYEKVSEKD